MAEGERNMIKFFGKRIEGVNAVAGSRDDSVKARALLVGSSNAITRLSLVLEQLEHSIETERAGADAELAALYASGCAALAAKDGELEAEASRIRRIEAERDVLVSCLVSALEMAEFDGELSIRGLLLRLDQEREMHGRELEALNGRLAASQRAAEAMRRDAALGTEDADKWKEKHERLERQLEREREQHVIDLREADRRREAALEEERSVARAWNEHADEVHTSLSAAHEAKARLGERLEELAREKAGLEAEQARLQAQIDNERTETALLRVQNETQAQEAEMKLVQSRHEMAIKAVEMRKKLTKKMHRMQQLQELALGMAPTSSSSSAGLFKGPRNVDAGGKRGRGTGQHHKTFRGKTGGPPVALVNVERRPLRRDLYWDLLKSKLEDHLEDGYEDEEAEVEHMEKQLDGSLFMNS